MMRIAVALFCLAGLFSSPLYAAESGGKKKIVLIAGNPSHGFGAHDHYAGCMLFAKWLKESGLPVDTVVVQNGWPKDSTVFNGADAIIIYADGGTGHPSIPHLKELDELMKKGVGLGCIHYGVEVPKGEPGDRFLDWIGGYFEMNWSINPFWTADYKQLPEHAVTRGVRPFSTNDEWYYHMRFREDMKGVTPILSAVPPEKTRQGPDGTHSGNPAVRARTGQSEITLWLAERPGGGRGFGTSGGHVHWNWAQDDWRKLVLNSIVWIAHVDVPSNGVSSKTPTIDDMLANNDEPIPANFNKEEMQKRLDRLNQQRTAAR